MSKITDKVTRREESQVVDLAIASDRYKWKQSENRMDLCVEFLAGFKEGYAAAKKKYVKLLTSQ